MMDGITFLEVLHHRPRQQLRKPVQLAGQAHLFPLRLIVGAA
jgi:hypothetical protein